MLMQARGVLAAPAVRLAAAARSAPRRGVSLAGRHPLFTAALAIGVLLRIVVMLGYQPAVLFKLDTYDYLWDAVHVQPNPVNPSGYALFLWLFRPFHSLVLVTAIQHLLGLAMAVLGYAVLRRWRVGPVIATIASLPVLLSPSQLILEQLVMADLLAMFLLVAALWVLLLRPVPSVRQCAVAGLLMGLSTIVRPTALPLIAATAAVLLIARVGWRRAGAVLVAGAVPVLGYMSWFAAANGSFNMTNSGGLFLWSRTMSFANCSVIKPPAGLRPLCPDRQPHWLMHPAGPGTPRALPKYWLWDHTDWPWQTASARQVKHGIVPDVAAFTAANNARALRFAIKAIEAQPTGYLHAVTREAAHALETSNGGLLFPNAQPPANLGPKDRSYALSAVQGYLGSLQGLGPYLSRHLGGRLYQPWARIVQVYQRGVILPNMAFAAALLIGLAGVVLPHRRCWQAALLWLCAVAEFILPIAEHEYTYRYLVPAIPLAFASAALATRRVSPASAVDRATRTVPAAISRLWMAPPLPAPGLPPRRLPPRRPRRVAP